jgi:hypothetical protein
MRSYLLLAMGWALQFSACKKPPEAPKELNQLSTYLYQEWDNEDPAVMEAGLANLRAFLRDEDLEGGIMDRSWELEPISKSDVSDIPFPKDADPKNTLGVAVSYLSSWPVADHAVLQLEEDQLPAEPSAKVYTRSFPDEGKPACFLDQSCDPLSSVNDIERQNLLLSVVMVLYKDFRWIETEQGLAVAARSWLEESFEGQNGSSNIVQSYSVDIWLPVGKKTWRYQTLWSESEVAGASDAATIGTLKSSIDRAMETADEAIEELYH